MINRTHCEAAAYEAIMDDHNWKDGALMANYFEADLYLYMDPTPEDMPSLDEFIDEALDKLEKRGIRLS